MATVVRKVGNNPNYGNVVARKDFTPAQQKTMDQGGNANGYAVVDGFFTYVGAGATGEAARARVFGGGAAAAPAAAPNAPVSPNAAGLPGKGWINGPVGVIENAQTRGDNMPNDGIGGRPTANPTTGQGGPEALAEARGNDETARAIREQTAADKLARDKDARARITSVLMEYDLGELGDWAWEQILAGKSEAEILQDLRNHPVFERTFPEIKQRTAKKLTPMSPGEIINYRKNARSLMRAAGMPSGFYDGNDDFSKFIVGDVSLSELNDRVETAKQATFEIPQAVRTRLEQRFGVQAGSGLLTSFFLDPDRALPLIQRDVRAAKVGGRADMAGYGGLSNDTAGVLADAGVGEDQAAQGFGELTRQKELFGSLDRGEDTIDQQTQLGATFLSEGGAQRRIQERQRRRQATFSDGGGLARGQRGVSGLQDPSRF